MTMTTDHLLDVSLAGQLRRVRGLVVRAVPGYPGSLHLHVQDADGRLWKFVSWDSDWAPSEPERFDGLTVEAIELLPTGRLTWRFSGGVTLTVEPRRPQETDDDPSYWELLTPDGLSLEFGPGALLRVQPSSAA